MAWRKSGKAKTNPEAEKRIAAAARNQATHLDLSGLSLETLPESISKLTALWSLYLFNNQLKELPEWISKLTALQTLSLSSNQLKGLSESLLRL